MTTRTNYHYAYALVFVAAMAALLLVAGSLGAGNTPQRAMHDIRIDISAMMATSDSSTLPVTRIEDPI
jgi:hypothetical protein